MLISKECRERVEMIEDVMHAYARTCERQGFVDVARAYRHCARILWCLMVEGQDPLDYIDQDMKQTIRVFEKVHNK